MALSPIVINRESLIAALTFSKNAIESRTKKIIFFILVTYLITAGTFATANGTKVTVNIKVFFGFISKSSVSS